MQLSLARKRRDEPGRTLPARWVWLAALPLGLGSWAPAYAGVVERKRAWVGVGLSWAAVTIAGWIASVGSSGSSGLGGGLIIVAWVGGFASSIVLRAVLRRDAASDFDSALARGRERLAARERGRELAHKQPALAKELGVGRPDLAGAEDAGLIDVNHVPASVLSSLPGIDDALAERIVAARDDVHGFSSLEDMGSVLDLDGALVEGLREQVVFLPR